MIFRVGINTQGCVVLIILLIIVCAISVATGLDVQIVILIVIIACIIFYAILSSKAKEQEEYQRKKKLDMEKAAEKEKEQYLTWLNTEYNITKIIGVESGLSWNLDNIFAVDELNKVVLFGRKEIPFSKILQVELKTVTSQYTMTDTKKNNPIGRAVVGGVIAGEAGALIGATSANQTSTSTTTINSTADGVVLYLSDINEPIFEYDNQNDKNNREVYAVILSIIASNTKQV